MPLRHHWDEMTEGGRGEEFRAQFRRNASFAQSSEGVRGVRVKDCSYRCADRLPLDEGQRHFRKAPECQFELLALGNSGVLENGRERNLTFSRGFDQSTYALAIPFVCQVKYLFFLRVIGSIRPGRKEVLGEQLGGLETRIASNNRASVHGTNMASQNDTLLFFRPNSRLPGMRFRLLRSQRLAPVPL